MECLINAPDYFWMAMTAVVVIVGLSYGIMALKMAQKL